MYERSKLSGFHDEDPGCQAEAKNMGSGLVNLHFEGHPEESPRLRVNGNVEVCVLKLMLCIHTDGRRAGQTLLIPAGGNLGWWLWKQALRPFLSRVPNCSWRISKFAGFLQDENNWVNSCGAESEGPLLWRISQVFLGKQKDSCRIRKR